MSKCRVTFTSTVQDHAVHIEESDNPDSLLFAAEDERAGPVFHSAWSYIRDHPASAIDVRFGSAMPHRLRMQVLTWFSWLLRCVLNGREEPN